MSKSLEIYCPSCESTFDLFFRDELVSGEPTYCPFCGEDIEDIEEYIDDDDNVEEDEW